jgi:transposase
MIPKPASDLLPAEHLVGTGYLDAELLVRSREEYEVDLVGPTRRDDRWQARADQGFAASDFTVNWEEQYAIRPAGKQSVKWNPFWSGSPRWPGSAPCGTFRR